MKRLWGDADLMAALQQPDAYPHPTPAVQVVETHISRVFLAGDFAYKVRKAVRFDFVDFSTARARHDDCTTELRLNRRFAPALYLDVVPIVPGPTPGSVRIGGSGIPIEHAVRMRRFDQDDLLSARVAANRLEACHIDGLARSMAAFHEAQPPAAPSGNLGTPACIVATLAECLRAIERLEPASHLASRVARGALSEATRLTSAFWARLRNGHVRECHGDLHLGNIVLLNGVPTPFDCLEFDAALRWTDTISDLAFPVMDLLHHGQAALAYRLLNGYLEQSGDYGALTVLPFYLAMRSLVRARVLLERASQKHAEGLYVSSDQAQARRLLVLAWACLRRGCGPMVLMHGLSGSGKSTIAAQLSEAGSMIRVRSDALRKRLHRGVMPCGGWYTTDATARAYRRLLAVCRLGCRAGFPMIADATFLVRAERERFAAQARRLGVPFAIVDCEASPETLRARIAARASAGGGPSDADEKVLAWQMLVQEHLTEAERACVASPDSFVRPARDNVWRPSSPTTPSRAPSKLFDGAQPTVRESAYIPPCWRRAKSACGAPCNECEPPMNELKRIPYQPIRDLLPRPASGTSERVMPLPQPDRTNGLPLMGALWQRMSTREFDEQPLSQLQLSELLWAAAGVNRSHAGGRTAPSPHGEAVIDVYAALPAGLYRYDPIHHCLVLKRAVDVRSMTGYQDFVGMAPVDLVYVANHGRMQDVPPGLRETFAAAAAGAMVQNAYLYCASAGLGAVVRGWLNRRQLAEHMSLNEDEVPILCQTIGKPARRDSAPV